MRSSPSMQYQISTIEAAELLKSKEDVAAIENFMFDVFAEHNLHVKYSYAKSSDPQLFASLFKKQIKSGLEQIIKADAANGVVIIAREKSASHSVVGFLMGIRNGFDLHSEDYMGEAFSPAGVACGMQESLMSAFGP